MKKVAPIFRPIALLTISTIIATATGVVNSGSYRQVEDDYKNTEYVESENIPAKENEQKKQETEISEPTIVEQPIKDINDKSIVIEEANPSGQIPETPQTSEEEPIVEKEIPKEEDYQEERGGISYPQPATYQQNNNFDQVGEGS